MIDLTASCPRCLAKAASKPCGNEGERQIETQKRKVQKENSFQLIKVKNVFLFFSLKTSSTVLLCQYQVLVCAPVCACVRVILTTSQS